MSNDDGARGQLRLVPDLPESTTKAERTPKSDTETVESGPYPEGTQTVHRLKITLRGVKPPIWRRIEAASDATLGDLSPMLEGAMGWYGGHLHAFDVDGTHYRRHDPEWETRGLDENKYRLGDVLRAVGAKMTWDYDFGDGWRHNVLVEAITPAESDLTYPLCIAGRRACPPEDCGGPWGYAGILEAWRDRQHPDREDLLAMVPPGFDPARFDLHQAQSALRAPRPSFDW